MENPPHDVVRVTIKQVAEAARVHYSTVSKALKGTGRIPEVTRARIREIANKIGYQQDPVMQALAAQRSQGGGVHREPRMVFLTNRWSMADTINGFLVRQLAEGVRQHAELIGCACDVLPFDDENLSLAEIERQCDPSRTEGLIIGAFDSLARQLELDWSRYSVVKIDSAFMLPNATLVASDQMQIARMAFHNAYRLGYRRIGMAIGQVEEEATYNLYSAGCYVAQEELAIPGIPILYLREHCDDYSITVRRMLEWVNEHRLQVVLSSWGSIRQLLCDCGLTVPSGVACVNLCLNSPFPSLAGVVQHHFVVGQKAAEALALLIMHRKQGLATSSAAIYVGGTWQDGPSAPPCDLREP
jgi:LacI family transcriptional regulator